MSRCHPTLASFLSGRWPHQTGIYYNFGTKKLAPGNSLPNLLKDAGYATYVEGKYWEGNPNAMGFTHGKGKTANSFVRKGQTDLFAFIDEVGGKQPLFIWWARPGRLSSTRQGNCFAVFSVASVLPPSQTMTSTDELLSRHENRRCRLCSSLTASL